MTQKRWYSKISWVAVVSIIMLVMSNYGIYDMIGMTSTVFKSLVDLVFVVLASVGIFNNPTSKENW